MTARTNLISARTDKRPFKMLSNDQLRICAAGYATIKGRLLHELAFRKSPAAARLRNELLSDNNQPQPAKATKFSSIRNAREDELRNQWRNTVLDKRGSPENDERIALIETEWQRRHKLPCWDTDIWGSSSPELRKMGHKRTVQLKIEDWPSTGMLAKLGYRVGRTSKLEPQDRRALLEAIYQSHLPPLNSPAYVALWGNPMSEERLDRMLTTIEGLAAHGRKRDGAEQAVDDWLSDAAYMYRAF